MVQVLLVLCYVVLNGGCQQSSPPSTTAGQLQRSPEQRPDPDYVRWLEEHSMLFQAARESSRISGRGAQWRHPYGTPQPRQIVRKAPVWLLDYAGSVIARPGQSVIATWADPQLWETLHDIGITLLHTGPVNRSGGIRRKVYTPTLDGWFDPISLEVDPQLGTEEEYQRLVRVAGQQDGLIAGDLVPLHTGTGADFRLALMAYRDYPGMYTMVEIRSDDWSILPRVDDIWTGAPVPKDAAEQLMRKGYIPGLINNNDAVKNARDLSGWAASGEITGVDGVVRRWVYLHYFKPGQPTLNWLDPSFAGPRAIAGDIVHQVYHRGARVLRLDAVPFMGIEPDPGKALSKHYQHALSIDSTDELAFLTRKLGGWTFHELNVPLSQLKKFTSNGPDLSYDFFTRAQYLHALLTGNAAPLRQSFQFLLDANIQPLTLVHDLQNHDEITYQLVELDHRKDEQLTLGERTLTGKELREQLLQEMRTKAAGTAAPHNKLYRPEQDGIATTFAAFVAAGLDIKDPYKATAAQVEQIKQGHLLLVLANAMQPGIFSLSSWDLVGALPVPQEKVQQWVGEGDYRWVNRGGVDLMGSNPDATSSTYGLPRAKALYGPIGDQLKRPDSFVSRLKHILAARAKYRIAEADLIAVAPTSKPAVCLLVLRLPDDHSIAVTALNFGRAEVEEELNLTTIKEVSLDAFRGQPITDILANTGTDTVPDSGRLKIKLSALSGRTLVLTKAAR